LVHELENEELSNLFDGGGDGANLSEGKALPVI
jgi:hypothetical protein